MIYYANIGRKAAVAKITSYSYIGVFKSNKTQRDNKEASYYQ